MSGLPEQEATQLYRQLMEGSLRLMTPLVLMMIVSCKHLLQLWIGADLGSVSGTVAIVLLCGAWCNSIAMVPFAYLQARGRPQVTAKIHMVEFIPFVLFLFAMVAAYGVVGAAVAWASRMLLDAILLGLCARDGGRAMLPLFLAHAAVIVACAWAVTGMVLSWPALVGVELALMLLAIAMNQALLKKLMGRRKQSGGAV